MIANRKSIGPWETFTFVGHRDGADTELLAKANNRYVTAEHGGALPLIANRTAVGPWEKFLIVNP